MHFCDITVPSFQHVQLENARDLMKKCKVFSEWPPMTSELPPVFTKHQDSCSGHRSQKYLLQRFPDSPGNPQVWNMHAYM